MSVAATGTRVLLLGEDERHLEEELVRLAEGALLKESERPEDTEEKRGD